jgi:hypothetical protein
MRFGTPQAGQVVRQVDRDVPEQKQRRTDAMCDPQRGWQRCRRAHCAVVSLGALRKPQDPAPEDQPQGILEAVDVQQVGFDAQQGVKRRSGHDPAGNAAQPRLSGGRRPPT